MDLSPRSQPPPRPTSPRPSSNQLPPRVALPVLLPPNKPSVRSPLTSPLASPRNSPPVSPRPQSPRNLRSDENPRSFVLTQRCLSRQFDKQGDPWTEYLESLLHETVISEEWEAYLARSNELLQVLKKRRINIKTKFNRIEELGRENVLRQKAILEHARNTRVLAHRETVQLVLDFITLKETSGSSTEKQLYKGMTAMAFISRTMEKRPLTFFCQEDRTLLRNGVSPDASDWYKVGWEAEGEIKLQDYMSFDELLISALFGASSPTMFINNGARDNVGKQGVPGSYEPFGILIGLVGARFEKINVMESLYCIIHEKFHTEENGYGENGEPQHKRRKMLALWAKFYNQGDTSRQNYYFPSYAEVNQYIEQNPDQTNFVAVKTLQGDIFFNYIVYKQRMRISAELFLFEADQRAGTCDKKAYCHVIGLGLGVWEFLPTQGQWVIEAYRDALTNHNFQHISDINFSWFADPKPELLSGINNIRVQFSKRNPAEKLVGEDEGKLLVAMYAWDSNAFAGNEYWLGQLSASGDPAAACCSTIAELQNPITNLDFSSNIWVHPMVEPAPQSPKITLETV